MEYMSDEAIDTIRQMQQDPFGLQLAKLRKEKGLSQNELAQLAGVSRPYVTQVENNTRTPTQETAVKLVTALGVGPEAVLFMTGTFTADAIHRMQDVARVLDIVRARLTEDEWTRFESTMTQLSWMLELATEISAVSDSPVAGVPLEPIPHWSALTPDNKRLVTQLVRQLADTNRQSEADTDAS